MLTRARLATPRSWRRGLSRFVPLRVSGDGVVIGIVAPVMLARRRGENVYRLAAPLASGLGCGISAHGGVGRSPFTDWTSPAAWMGSTSLIPVGGAVAVGAQPVPRERVPRGWPQPWLQGCARLAMALRWVMVCSSPLAPGAATGRPRPRRILSAALIPGPKCSSSSVSSVPAGLRQRPQHSMIASCPATLAGLSDRG